MKYLLDKDHLSILQRQTRKDYENLFTRMTRYPVSDFAVSTVTFHEQMRWVEETKPNKPVRILK